MKVKTIVDHVTAEGKELRWCIRCGVHLDKYDKIDLDFYTARQYLKFMKAGISCEHVTERPDSKEHLLNEVEQAFLNGALNEEQRELLEKIVRRLS